jgi:hypothetical protein
MANAHITAAYHCSQFRGTARQVLLYLADAASSLSQKDAKEQKKLPFGHCKRKLATIMCALNIHRQQTVSRAIAELKAAGAIKQWLKKGASPLYFVDLDWLKVHEYTNDQIESFDYDALRVAREKEKQAEEQHNEDPDDDTIENLFPTRESPVSHGSEQGEAPATPAESTTRWSPAGDPPYGDPSETLGQRKAANIDNGNRITSVTESVVVKQRKAANSSHSVPTSSLRFEGFDPPSDDGIFPTASRDKSVSDTSLRSEDQHQDQEQPQELHLVPADADVPAYPSVAVHPPAPQAIAVPPAAPPPDTRLRCKGNYCQRVLQTEEEIRRGKCNECLEWQRKENAKWVHPRDTHDWSKDKNVCDRCGTTREELKYENIYCEAPQAKAAVAPFEGQD